MVVIIQKRGPLTTDVVWTAGVLSEVRHQLLSILTLRGEDVTQGLVTNWMTDRETERQTDRQTPSEQYKPITIHNGRLNIVPKLLKWNSSSR